MLIEYCDGGALDSIMVELEKPLNELQIAYVCKHMTEGLDFLHNNKVIHRDLKAGNVLLTMEGGVKLGECYIDKNAYQFINSVRLIKPLPLRLQIDFRIKSVIGFLMADYRLLPKRS